MQILRRTFDEVQELFVDENWLEKCTGTRGLTFCCSATPQFYKTEVILDMGLF